MAAENGGPLTKFAAACYKLGDQAMGEQPPEQSQGTMAQSLAYLAGNTAYSMSSPSAQIDPVQSESALMVATHRDKPR